MHESWKIVIIVTEIFGELLHEEVATKSFVARETYEKSKNTSLLKEESLFLIPGRLIICLHFMKSLTFLVFSQIFLTSSKRFLDLFRLLGHPGMPQGNNRDTVHVSSRT